MIDVTEQINAVRREVGGRMLDAGQARVVTVSRSYPAELADVWDQPGAHPALVPAG